MGEGRDQRRKRGERDLLSKSLLRRRGRDSKKPMQEDSGKQSLGRGNDGKFDAPVRNQD